MEISKPNWPLLAGWRFFLAIIVVIFHMQVMWGGTIKGGALFSEFGANHAVLCFLLLSGFSIGHSIKERPSGFLVRRFWRIYPVYLTCFMLSVLPFVLWIPVQRSVNNFVLEPPSFLQGIVHFFIAQPFLSRSYRIFNPSWTLGVEWGFYMLAPLFLKLSRNVLRWLIGLSTAIFWIAVNKYSLSEIAGPLPYLALLWVWLLGFYLVCFGGQYTSFLLMCAPLLIIHRFGQEPLGPFLWTATVTLIFLGSKIPVSAKMKKIMHKMGDLSYSLYLIHVVAFSYFFSIFHSNNGMLMMLFALLMSIIIHYCVELPVNYYRRRAVKNKAALSLAIQ
jgi:peptidoglycan/LPS O-acetylase OafA/YrhL